jgi:hypothetical protein
MLMLDVSAGRGEQAGFAFVLEAEALAVDVDPKTNAKPNCSVLRRRASSTDGPIARSVL